MTDKQTIIIRCDGSPSIGLGHVVRCLALAKKMSMTDGITVHFAVRSNETAIAMIEQHGFSGTLSKIITKDDYGRWLIDLCKKNNTKILVLDSRDGLSLEQVNEIKNHDIFVVSIDDIEEKRLACDVLFYPPIKQVNEWSWDGFQGKKYCGWEYVILREEFSIKYDKTINFKPRLLISMGGSDPKRLTTKILNVLIKTGIDCSIDVLLSSVNINKAEIYELSKLHTSIIILENPPNVAQVMAQADVAIISFGVTAYEVAAVGTPAIFICLHTEQLDSAKTFVDSGFAINLGKDDSVTDKNIDDALTTLLFSKHLQSDMKFKLSELKLSDGAKKISDIILNY